jgi:hypothetical protein
VWLCDGGRWYTTIMSTAKWSVTPMPNMTSAGRSPRELWFEVGAASGEACWGGGGGMRTSQETRTVAVWARCASVFVTRLCHRSVLLFLQHTLWSHIGSDGSSQSGQGIADAANGMPRCQWGSLATSAALNHSQTACDGMADHAQLTDLDKQVSLHASRRGKAEMSAESSLCATDWFQNLCDIQSLSGSARCRSPTFMPAMSS